MNRDTMDEGSVPDAEERDPSIFWGDNKGPVVIVWDGMLPGEQESADRQFQETTFLEQHGIRLEGTKPKGTKSQRTSENFSRGGFTRRKGW